jgi:hypothetical protein
VSLGSPIFTKINESFACAHCGHAVPKSESTCRDHCSQCLYSLHVDVNPGDRAANCGGLLKPVAWSQHKKKGYMIHYVCEKCGEKRVNKFLDHDSEPDSFPALIELSNVT